VRSLFRRALGRGIIADELAFWERKREKALKLLGGPFGSAIPAVSIPALAEPNCSRAELEPAFQAEFVAQARPLVFPAERTDLNVVMAARRSTSNAKKRITLARNKINTCNWSGVTGQTWGKRCGVIPRPRISPRTGAGSACVATATGCVGARFGLARVVVWALSYRY